MLCFLFQEPKSNVILHQFPLHKISYCADEKGVKKFFSFIAKTGTSVQALTNGDTTSINTSSSSSVGSVTGNSEESHECFVFISNKLASDITLTIGQAFDLAYRRYMTDSGKQFEITKLQSHNKILENTVETYRSRLRELSECLPKSDLDKVMLRLGVRDICEVPVVTDLNAVDGNKTPDLGKIDIETTLKSFLIYN
jgi:PTB domain-containing engulfment adapter protein 1